MQAKVFEVFDRASWFTVLAVKYSGSDEREQCLLNQSGLGRGSGYSLQLTDLHTGQTQRDPYRWGSGRSFTELHKYVRDNYDSLVSGDVIDIEYVLGEKDTPKLSYHPITVESYTESYVN